MQSGKQCRRRACGVLRSFLALLMLSACARGPFQDDFDGHPRSADCFMVAPIVVTGKITRVQQVGDTRRPRKGPKIWIDPVQITVSVEHVIKGSVEGRTIQIFGFRPNRAHVFGDDPFDPRPGEIRLFLLRSESGRLRILTDNFSGAYAPRLGTGQHPNVPAAVLSDPGRTIAFVLLAPGEGHKPRAGDIVANAYVGMALTHDKEWLISLLRPYTQDPDQWVRSAAEAAIHDLGLMPKAWQPPDGPCPAKLP